MPGGAHDSLISQRQKKCKRTGYEVRSGFGVNPEIRILRPSKDATLPH
jgi:hypothetical protein